MIPKRESANQIAAKIALYPEGITSGELFDRYHTLYDPDTYIIRKEGVDLIQKAVNRLIHKELVTVRERTANSKRTYFPTDKFLEQTEMPAKQPIKYDPTDPENVALFTGIPAIPADPDKAVLFCSGVVLKETDAEQPTPIAFSCNRPAESEQQKIEALKGDIFDLEGKKFCNACEQWVSPEEEAACISVDCDCVHADMKKSKEEQQSTAEQLKQTEPADVVPPLNPIKFLPGEPIEYALLDTTDTPQTLKQMNEGIHDIWSNMSNMLYSIQHKTTLNNAKEICDDLTITAEMLRSIRPDLAESLSKAQQYIMNLNSD